MAGSWTANGIRHCDSGADNAVPNAARRRSLVLLEHAHYGPRRHSTFSLVRSNFQSTDTASNRPVTK